MSNTYRRIKNAKWFRKPGCAGYRYLWNDNEISKYSFPNSHDELPVSARKEAKFPKNIK
jgi:hypothetical protein